MRRLLLALSSLLACLVVGHTASAQTPNPSDDVSVGVFPFLVGNMDPQIPALVTELQQRDVDTLYVSVFRATGPSAGTLYVNDPVAGWNPAWGPVRPGNNGINLVSLIQAAHAAGMPVVGVLKCFDDSVQPSDPAHVQYLYDVVDYLVGSYNADGTPVFDLDGLALDYVRYVESAPSANAADVTAFVQGVRNRIGNMSLHAYLVAFRYAFDGPVYNGSFNSYNQVRQTLINDVGQDWEALAPLLDVMMPMAYTGDGTIYNTFTAHRAYVAQTVFQARQAAINSGAFFSTRFIPVVQTYNGPSGTATASTIDASVTGALLSGADGYQSFRWGTMTGNAAWWNAFQAYAQPGQQWPVAKATTTAQGSMGVDLDLTASTDGDQPVGTPLTMRVDRDFDGTYDTPWVPVGALDLLAREPGGSAVGLAVRDLDDHVSVTRRQLAGGDALSISAQLFFAASGNPVTLRLDLGPNAAGRLYGVIAGISGSTPGTTWQGGFRYPVNIDVISTLLFDATVNGLPFLTPGIGLLDAQGRATVTFQTPPGLLDPLKGSQVSWGAGIVDSSFNPLAITNAVNMFIF